MWERQYTKTKLIFIIPSPTKCYEHSHFSRDNNAVVCQTVKSAALTRAA